MRSRFDSVGRSTRWVCGSFVVALVLASGCSTASRSIQDTIKQTGLIPDGRTEISSEAPESYRRGAEHLSSEKYDLALLEFEKHLQNQPASVWTQSAIFGSARALEGLERWTEAAERYRQVIHNTRRAPNLQAMALYRLSFCREALGNDQETVAVLHDALTRSQHLPKEITMAELPARLAAAYARVGNFEKALSYYQSAEKGIYSLRRESAGKPLPSWLARTLFFMGNTSLRQATWEDFETYLRPLGRTQVYLLLTTELSIEPWSQKAAHELVTTYQSLWNAIESVSLPSGPDPVIAKREIQEKQWRRAALVLETLEALKARVPPEEQKASDETKMILAFVGDLEKRIGDLFLERPAGEGMTAEALSRRKEVRARVVNPDDSLERRFLESSRAVEMDNEPFIQQPILPSGKPNTGESLNSTDPNL